MPYPERLTATVSTNGQVILPKAIRDQRRWGAGTKLVVEDTEHGVLLRTAPLFAATELGAVFGSLALPAKGRRSKRRTRRSPLKHFAVCAIEGRQSGFGG
jgi:AbrB family looped-hinge helix DNA binding protein